MQYAIVTSHSIKSLETLVNEYLQDGWKCQGGIAVMFASKGMNDKQFFQSMIK